MKKIIYICSTLEQTGPTSQLYNIISGLDDVHYCAKVVTLSPEKSKSLSKKFESAGIDVHCIDPTGKIKLNDLKHLIVEFIKDAKADVVHTQGIRADLIMCQVIKTIPTKWVATLRNIPYLDYPPQYGMVKGLLMAALHILALRQCDNLVVVSHAISDKLSKFFGENLNVIPNGIDTAYYSSHNITQQLRDSIKDTLYLDSNKKLIVYTGVLEDRKNIKMMLDVFEQSNDFQLLMVGDGSLMQMVQSHNATITRKVIPIGSVSDVRPYLSLADAFILISKAEGLPNSVLEAMAMNIPSILSNIGPHQEIKKSSAALVHIVNIDNTSELTTFLAREYDVWRSHIPEGECRLLAENCFSATYNSACYQRLYS
ncbi:glycosyltransferase family 4 protein [Aeromonas dhakensis]|uniref:glycosyltransferase family 4 protein n=1 Tax=Aeromonas dhakensis TaxID=196024 RepID=UPI003571122D